MKQTRGPLSTESSTDTTGHHAIPRTYLVLRHRRDLFRRSHALIVEVFNAIIAVIFFFLLLVVIADLITLFRACHDLAVSRTVSHGLCLSFCYLFRCRRGHNVILPHAAISSKRSALKRKRNETVVLSIHSSDLIGQVSTNSDSLMIGKFSRRARRLLCRVSRASSTGEPGCLELGPHLRCQLPGLHRTIHSLSSTRNDFARGCPTKGREKKGTTFYRFEGVHFMQILSSTMISPSTDYGCVSIWT